MGWGGGVRKCLTPEGGRLVLGGGCREKNVPGIEKSVESRGQHWEGDKAGGWRRPEELQEEGGPGGGEASWARAGLQGGEEVWRKDRSG